MAFRQLEIDQTHIHDVECELLSRNQSERMENKVEFSFQMSLEIIRTFRKVTNDEFVRDDEIKTLVNDETYSGCYKKILPTMYKTFLKTKHIDSSQKVKDFHIDCYCRLLTIWFCRLQLLIDMASLWLNGYQMCYQRANTVKWEWFFNLATWKIIKLLCANKNCENGKREINESKHYFHFIQFVFIRHDWNFFNLAVGSVSLNNA